MDFTAAQIQTVQAVASSAHKGGWERLLADIEILEHAKDFQVDYVCLAVVRDAGGQLAVEQFRLSPEARDAVVDLYRQRKDQAGETIGGFELTIDSSGDQPGRYRFQFLHGAPKRINGEWDEERENRLDNYLDVYKAELAAQ